MHRLHDRGYTPKVTPHKGCRACSLREECLPSLLKNKSVRDYLRAAKEEEP